MRHQSLLSGLVFAALVTVGRSASADVTVEGNPVERTAGPDAKFSLGCDVALTLPIGGFSDLAGPGVGLLVRFEYELRERLNLTGRLGYIYNFSHDVTGGSVGASLLPLWGGIKYFPLGDAVNDGFYLAPEIGLESLTGRFTSSSGASYASGSSSDLRVGITAMVGYTFGNLDFRAGFLFADVGHISDSMSIMFNAGYTFLRF